MPKVKTYQSFSEFYPYYLSEHSNLISRRLHFIATTISVVLLVTGIVSQIWWLFLLAFVQAYTLAWVGHFFFEHNKPATFEHPWLSFRGDWYMWWETLTGKIHF